METRDYTEDDMNYIREKLLELKGIVSELEARYPERHFTLDGHLIGSIGEIMAAYHYGIELHKASSKTHDGIVDGREVQIKITQQENIAINDNPEYLLVLYMSKTGDVYEVYNGPGKEPWDTSNGVSGFRSRHIRLNKLMELDAMVAPRERIRVRHPIPKMEKRFKNN